MYCVRCGAHNPDGAKFCSKCGAAVTADESPAAAPPAAPHAHAERAASHAQRSAHPTPPPRPPIARAGFVFPTISFGRIQDLRTARASTMCGVVAAVAGVIMSLVGVKAFGSTLVVTAAIYAVIGFFIWKSSRIAAVVGLLLSIANIFGMLAITTGAPRQGIIFAMALLVLLYWNAVRGTLAEHRLAGGQLKTA